MEIQYFKGDLLSSSENVICHGCNSHGVMKSGIAKLIRERWPIAYDVYRAAYDLGELKVGTITMVHPMGGPTIINAVTQKNYGRDPTVVYANYTGIRQCLYKINEHARLYESYDRVAFPLIGAGLANGSWKIISGIIEETAINFRPVVYVLDGKIPTT